MLSVHSYYSLRFGCLSPKEIIEQAQAMEWPKFLHCDINNCSASMDMLRLAKQQGLEICLGIDFRNSAKACYIGIARNNKGFKELNDHLSDHLRLKNTFANRAPAFEHVSIVYPFSQYPETTILAPNEYIGIGHRDLQKLKFSTWLKQPDKLIAFEQASFRNKRDFNAHRLLRAIDNNTLLSKLSPEEVANPDNQWRHIKETNHLFSEFPFLLTNSDEVLAQCQFDSSFGKQQEHQNLQAYTESEEGDWQLIQKLCRTGRSYRYPQADDIVLSRIKKELEIIRQKKFLSYFLINWDITSYARSKGYFYIGRGSGANSIVAYILRITDVDPVDLDLYFERFINLYRQNPPDFDLDFSWLDRDDVTRYIFSRFKHVALLAVYNTFQYKAVIRELGKVFGLPKHEIDGLASGHFPNAQDDHIIQLVLRYSTYIQGFPNHLSIHAGGILIAEQDIHHYSATFLPPKGYPTTMFDMVVAEDIGLYKFDILSQRGLGKIKEALEIARENQPDAQLLDIHDIPALKKDPGIKDLLRSANAIGCFYVESPAMRMLLTKLQVDNYLGLVAASSVIRPGVAKSGMMREYIQRYRFPEKRKEAHPILQDIMPETFGVMVYQEDVIKVAHYFAGLSLAEADVLRRGMSGKFRSREEFEKARIAFFQKAAAKGHAPDLVAEIWRQTESFAGYAFAKGHSASYAVESYQSLYLKAYFPREYMVATLNNFGGFYRTELYIQEARKQGAVIHPPCINYSMGKTIIRGKIIYLGFGLVKNIDQRMLAGILKERQENGPYLSLDNLIQRSYCTHEQVALLIRCGGFEFTGKSKKALLWEMHLLLKKTPEKMPEKTLFQTETRTFQLPQLYSEKHEDAFDQIELFGFPLCDPFELLAEHHLKSHYAAELSQRVGQRVSVLAYLVTVKKTRTSNGKIMYFGSFLDQKGEWIDTVHFPPIVQQYPLRGRGIYRINGRVVSEFDCLSIEVDFMSKCAMIADPRYDDVSTSNKIRAHRQIEQEPRKASA